MFFFVSGSLVDLSLSGREAYVPLFLNGLRVNMIGMMLRCFTLALAISGETNRV